EGAPDAPRQQRRDETPAGADGGWLTGLLARASDGDQMPAARRMLNPAEPRREQAVQRAPRPAGGPLDHLAADIDHLVDGQAMLDVWERYRRGERNVFSRRLYTQAGLQALEDVRARYGQNRDFRQTVDRYIGEFE